MIMELGAIVLDIGAMFLDTYAMVVAWYNGMFSTRTWYFSITMASEIASINRCITTFITGKHIYNNICFYSLSQVVWSGRGQVGGGYPRTFSKTFYCVF